MAEYSMSFREASTCGSPGGLIEFYCRQPWSRAHVLGDTCTPLGLGASLLVCCPICSVIMDANST